MGRLFWKLFLGAWSLALLMALGVGWFTALLIDDEGIVGDEPALAYVLPRVHEVRRALEQRGEEAARAVLERDAGRFPNEVLVVDPKGRDLLDRPIPAKPAPVPAEPGPQGARQTAEVASPVGLRYRMYLEPPLDLHPPGQRPLRAGMPTLLLRHIQRQPRTFALRLAAVLCLSALLALLLSWHLTRPIEELHEASRRLGAGDLDARVAPALGGRRDELAELAADFDRMAERIQALITAQHQLYHDVSHELRSPLARVQVALGLARKKATPEFIPELDRIEGEAERLGELVGEVLTLARLESEVLELRPVPVELAALLEEVRRDAEFEAAARSCEVVMTVVGEWTLKADYELIHRAVENLVRDGVRHTFDGTTVTVTLGPHPKRAGWARISVCNQGTGVQEGRIEDLFKPFVHASAARERRAGGHGLGLAIAQRAITLHGGEIDAVNRPEGGLCVRISLPCPG